MFAERLRDAQRIEDLFEVKLLAYMFMLTTLYLPYTASAIHCVCQILILYHKMYTEPCARFVQGFSAITTLACCKTDTFLGIT